MTQTALQFDLVDSTTDLIRRATWGGKSARNRITLERYWDPNLKKALVIGCNPSTADAMKEDPTSRWWLNWFKQAGFGGYIACNLYPFCTSSPSECKRIADWEHNGPDWWARDDILDNLSRVTEVARSASQIFVCWGAIAWDPGWIDQFIEELAEGLPDVDTVRLWCWGVTKSGAPKHPMARGKHRIPADQKPILWREIS